MPIDPDKVIGEEIARRLNHHEQEINTSSKIPSSDLQSRLDAIIRHANSVMRDVKTRQPTTEDITDLAYMVSYLAAIVSQHFRTGER